MLFLKRIELFLQSLVRPPSHPFHLIWDAVISLISLFFMAQIIFVLCFEQAQILVHQHMQLLYRVFWSILTTNIIIKFFKAVRLNGLMCQDFRKISIKYLKCKFILNVLINTALILSIELKHPSAVYLRLFIFMNIWDLWNYQDEIFRFVIQNSFFRQLLTLCNIFLLQLFGIHLASCLFYLIGYTLVKKQHYGNIVTNSELYWLTSRVTTFPIIQLSIGQQYMWSFYSGASVISTIVIGDIVGHNPIETGFVIFLIFVGTISQAYVFGLVVNLWSSTYLKIKDYLKQIQIFGVFMRKHKFQSGLQHQIRSFLQYKWIQEEEQKILSKLPKNIRERILINQFQKQLLQIDFFGKVLDNKRLLGQFTNNLKQRYYFKDQILIDCFENSDDVIFICQGTTQGYFQYDRNSKLLSNFYHQNKKVLNIDGLFSQNCHKRIIKSTTRVTALKMNSSNFNSILKKTPEIYQQFKQIKHQVTQNNNFKVIGYKCECCEQSDHNVLECRECHLDKNINHQVQQNHRGQCKRKGGSMLKSKRIVSAFNMTRFSSLQQIKKDRIHRQFVKYTNTAWQKLHKLTQQLEDNQCPSPTLSNYSSCLGETFECVFSFENYFPQNNCKYFAS